MNGKPPPQNDASRSGGGSTSLDSIDIDHMYDECERVFTILRHIVENDTMNCGYQWQDYTLEVLDSYELALQKLHHDIQGQSNINNVNNSTTNSDLSEVLKNKTVVFE